MVKREKKVRVKRAKRTGAKRPLSKYQMHMKSWMGSYKKGSSTNARGHFKAGVNAWNRKKTKM